jgi:hypothetical protein
MNLIRTLLASIVLAASAVSAAASGGADVPPRADNLQLVGEARLDFLFWDVYDSRLYCPGGEYEPGVRPQRLEIEYLLDIRAEDLVKRTAKEWDAIGMTHPNRAAWLADLEKLWPDVDKNDVLTLEIDRDEQATFYRNDERLGTIADPDFGRHFADIWLSPQTSRPKIRIALIGGKDR